jgi:hypothetical protein
VPWLNTSDQEQIDRTPPGKSILSLEFSR